MTSAKYPDMQSTVMAFLHTKDSGNDDKTNTVSDGYKSPYKSFYELGSTE